MEKKIESILGKLNTKCSKQQSVTLAVTAIHPRYDQERNLVCPVLLSFRLCKKLYVHHESKMLFHPSCNYCPRCAHAINLSYNILSKR
jgi:hypothetical protein